MQTHRRPFISGLLTGACLCVVAIRWFSQHYRIERSPLPGHVAPPQRCTPRQRSTRV